MNEMKLCNSNRIDLVVYHGKCGGDIEGIAFRGEAVFFAPTAELASTYAEHVCMNGDVDYGYDTSEDEVAMDEAFLGSNPVVYKIHLRLENPAHLDETFVSKIAIESGVVSKKVGRFVENFEDSCPDERKIVFEWVKSHGYDGAVISKDMMPLRAGGDSDWFPSYVSFKPTDQVKFILAEPEADQQKSQQPIVVDGFHVGKVLDISAGVVTQQVNRDGSTVRHLMSQLSKSVEIDAVVEIGYANGVGEVSSVRARSQLVQR
ncbi:hypothetical protein Rfer_4446 (plasmid) [Rhodoferax ferrireducens T118]|uniref:KfrB domain-containing protein n=1 Tax=Albidiferax ferrireducens (strain ATCC BAA-621 / DSM 15236 / T118) TaxID=338969 RepID=Q21Q13_ALBFT|nr:hypothetical protein [Rhodoferax ferrireducens]ABD72132.1 hypothetical protein Rfer_4446 [Rhodoferax ferrireducens T118]